MNMEQIYKQAAYIFLFIHFLPKAESMRSNFSNKVKPCGKYIYVTTEVQLLHIDKNAVLCEWIIKASKPYEKISVSAVNISISYNEPDLDIFSLRIIDYELDKFNDFVILKEWKHVSVFHESFLEIVHSHSDAIQINYKLEKQGLKSHFEFKLLVYVCGGIQPAGISFFSPQLSTIPSYYWPHDITCNWVFEMPPKTKLFFVKTETMKGDFGLSIIKTEGEFFNITTGSSYIRYQNEKNQHFDPFQLIPKAVQVNSNKIQVKSNSCSGFSLAFNSKKVQINYYAKKPTDEELFVGVFGPHEQKTEITDAPWYLDYCYLVFFFPLGLIIGIIFIIYQRRDTIESPQPLRPTKRKLRSKAGNKTLSTELSENGKNKKIISAFPSRNQNVESQNKNKRKTQIDSPTDERKHFLHKEEKVTFG